MKLHTNCINSNSHVEKTMIVLIFLSVHPSRMHEYIFKMGGFACVWNVRFYHVLKYHFLFFSTQLLLKNLLCDSPCIQPADHLLISLLSKVGGREQ